MTPPPSPTLRRHDDPTAFLAAAGPFLARRETEHTVPLGVATGMVEHPDLYAPNPYLATVDLDEEVVAAAVMTPPHRLLLSFSDHPASSRLIADDLLASSPAPSGVVGPDPAVLPFLARWRERTGQGATPGMAQRLYRLDRVRPLPRIPRVPGALRPASERDRDLLVAWMAAFTAEALDHAEPDRIARAVDLRLRARDPGFFLWQDDEPTTMVGASGKTPNGIRIAPVYTPPHLRHRGYATAAVAAASRTLLAGGRRFCCLFADLANPGANRIYEKIGCEPVLDVTDYRLAPPSA